jgi:hypothetical protein
MDSITTIPSTEITTNDKKGEIENLRPSSKTPFKSSEEKLVIEYVPTKTRPIANVELVSTDNVKTYTVQFFNADGTVTTRKVSMTPTKAIRLMVSSLLYLHQKEYSIAAYMVIET